MHAGLRHRRVALQRRNGGLEEGAVAIIVAVGLVAFLGLVALSVDLGALYKHDRDIQTMADAGALAGAQELIWTSGDQGAAGTKAQEYVAKNAKGQAAGSTVTPENLESWSPAVDAQSVTVVLNESHVPFSFAPVIGKSEGAVTARARAQVVYVTGINTNKVFPVAINYMHPKKFRFVFKNGSTFVTSFDITESDPDSGVFDVGGGGCTPTAPGLYTIDLQAIGEDVNHNEVVGVELPGIGLWRVANPSDPKEKLYRIGLDRSGSNVTISVVMATSVVDASISGSLGGNSFTLTRETDGTYKPVTVAIPTGTGNEGWATYDVTLDKKIVSGSVARVAVFHPDVPLRSVTMTPTFDGYSGVVNQHASFGATVVTRDLHFGTYELMKLGNKDKDGPLYSGNWRLADLYTNVNAKTEIGTVPVPEDWELYHPLVIGGPLEPQTGVVVGQIVQGLQDRFAGHEPAFTRDELESGGLTLDYVRAHMPENDPYFVIVPIIEFTDVRGSSEPYIISAFAGFYITDYDKSGQIGGVFIEWATNGTWSTNPPGPVYLKTAVLTQ